MSNLELYKSYDQTVAPATVDLEVVFAITGVDLIIVNDDAAETVSIKLNSSTNDSIFIGAGEVWTFNKFVVTKIYLTNPAVAGVNLRIAVLGDEVV